MRADFKLESSHERARAGTVTIPNGTISNGTGPRGSFETPCFMPVGTRGAVRHLDAVDLKNLGTSVMLANTYHLMLRPGADLIAAMGGIHAFTGWNGHILTDSGGFQIFSLDAKATDEGATFRSVYDGSECQLSPETAVQRQAQIGADITMVLDVCPPAEAPREEQEIAVKRTALWAKRARQEFQKTSAETQAQFGIVQGGTHPDLRALSTQQTVDIGFDGYAIGGLSVGENRPAMLDAVDACVDHLPTDQPRYFMGLGDPVGIIECVARGVDMFDCVHPTRLARHGTVLSDAGRYNLSNAAHANSDEPLDPAFTNSPAAHLSRGYLRHLLATHEPTAARMLTLHNVAWMLRFMGRIRDSIADGTLDTLRRETQDLWA